MDWIRLQGVLVVCIPVFTIIGMGKILAVQGVLNKENRNFINWLTYNFALPALILSGVARQRFIELFNIPLVAGPILAILLITCLYIFLARLLNLRGSLAAAFVFGTFWANVSYMGFPLASNAYGADGMSNAAIYNAFVMPLFVILAFTVIAVYGAENGGKFGTKIRRAFINPIVLSALVGIIIALLAEIFRDGGGKLTMTGIPMSLVEVSGSFLELLGSMGLPLALLAVGSSMHLNEIKKRLGLLLIVLFGKLVLLPFLTFLLLRIFFPSVDSATFGVAVMMSATPSAVASYVVARQIGVEEGFVSSMLVLSTALSIVAIPVWLYIVL